MQRVECLERRLVVCMESLVVVLMLDGRKC